MTTAAADPPTKRRRKNSTKLQPLLPGLPDHVAQLPLSLLPPSLLFSVSRSWRRVLYTPSFPPFLSLYTLSLSSPPDKTHFSNSLEFASFDPILAKWIILPPPPESSLRPILRHPSYISRYLPIQSVTVSGNLVLLAGTGEDHSPAFPRPLVFNPRTRSWVYGPRMNHPRRWCAGGACGGAVIAASGIGSHFTTKVSRFVEKWDLNNYNLGKMNNLGEWVKLGELESGKMSREAIGAVGWRGKLLVTDVTAAEGAAYDLSSDTWREMKEGMIGGWRGPAATMDEEALFVVDESKGVLKRYDADGDTWEDALWAPELKGAEQIAAGGGRVCVLRNGGEGIVVVDVVTKPARFWTLETPNESQVLAVHILPRISRSEFVI